MSRQSTRNSGEGALDPALVQKKRARHRLVGAVCLCVLAAIVVPMVLESEPRVGERTLPMELAGGADAARTSPAPAAVPGSSTTPAAPASGPSAAAPGPAVAASSPTPAVVASAPDAVADAGRSTVRTVTPPATAPSGPAAPPRPAQPPAHTAQGQISQHPGSAQAAAAARPSAPPAAAPGAASAAAAGRPAAQPDAVALGQLIDRASASHAARTEAARSAPVVAAAPSTGTAAGGARPGNAPAAAAQAGRAPSPAAAPSTAAAPAGTAPPTDARTAAARRFLVQVGAYSNVQSARTVSDRIAQAGLRPYQETVKTAQGDWIRVRVGPFPTRQDAERAQQDLKRVGVAAAIIAL